MKKQFKGKQYDYRIIIEAIGLYYHFGLSYRACCQNYEEIQLRHGSYNHLSLG